MWHVPSRRKPKGIAFLKTQDKKTNRKQDPGDIIAKQNQWFSKKSKLWNPYQQNINVLSSKHPDGEHFAIIHDERSREETGGNKLLQPGNLQHAEQLLLGRRIKTVCGQSFIIKSPTAQDFSIVCQEWECVGGAILLRVRRWESLE